MYTILLLLIFAGSFFWYSSSEKVKIKHAPALILPLMGDKIRAKILSIVLLGLSWVLTMYLQGLLSGTLAFGAYSMGFFSLIVLLWPYRYFQWKQLAFVFLFSLFLETIIF
ncbi:hypothetical protein [Sphingobacterium athyrii]|uniref:DUF3325 domain-containing protein n=1 Tax=Sphingobacterium athyrii TaxID=2152717 RepID=A0A363NQP4_9SPHI|nr:hypothetical protein [Sphingobacterium athyrii]PUV22981.1 hypothetical protein DCO56_18855 [Sphingobacterium athyrii]